MDRGGPELNDRADAVLTAETAVVEIEELRPLIAEGQEKGSLSAERVLAAVEEAGLTGDQGRHLFSYLEEHEIEVDDVAEAVSRGKAAGGGTPPGGGGGTGPAGERARPWPGGSPAPARRR